MKKAALVTGASRGIGLELTRCLAKEGTSCVVVARSEDRLREVKREFESTYGTSIKVIGQDLSRPSAPDELVGSLRDDDIFVHTLINNAGFANYGRFVDHEWSREFDLLQLNVVALTHLTRLLVEPMVERGEGRILNVASTASFVPGPYMATYYASKAYVLNFSEGLAGELSDCGVTVTALCPGFTDTGFQEQAGLSETGLIEKIPLRASPDEVAEYGYRAMKKGKLVAVHGVINRLMVFFLRFLPRCLIRSFVVFIQGGPLRKRAE